MAKTKKRAKKSLVIVESPAKARTLSGILGDEYDIRASVGHIRDLPKSKLGVDTEHGFKPQYLIPKEKRPVVEELRKAAKKADIVYLATDPDREGEAISWHIVEAAELEGKEHQRVVFHEITPEAVKEAFNHPRPIDQALVDAQQARRVLDRLVGYQISPFLWKKIRRGLSAGRVQSVALRIVVEREREIQAFNPQEYWTIEVDLSKADAEAAGSLQFAAKLAGIDGKRKVEIPNGAEAERLTALLNGAAFQVTEIKKKPQSRRPAPPFTTSTLQQEASRRFSYSTKRTMAIAQQLYEGLSQGSEGQVGFITYMRTDSTNIADSAKRDAREFITQRFGGDFVPESPRTYRTKAKRAQEAHEAIRPTSVERDPESLSAVLNRDQLLLYTLIWQRFVACQMADAILDLTTVEIDAQPADGSQPLFLRANESVLRFAGYRQLYEEQREEEDQDEDKPTERGLPPLDANDALRLAAVRPDQHFTEPPPRFTEASLVKALEDNGIGRPSTYAPILSTIQDRGYVRKEGRALHPEELGTIVNDLLIEHFPNVFDPSFTANMEEELDEIARGERPWAPVVKQFYDPLQVALESAAAAPKVEEATDEKCDLCGKAMVARWGRYGRFLSCTGFPECKGTKPLEGEESGPTETDETCDLCQAPMVMRRGRFGKFIACSRYPDCKGTKQVHNKVGIDCPKCGADIVERQTRKRRTFYGCSAYPKCDFTSWTRPLPDPCPDCGKLITAVGRVRKDGKRNAKCTECEWTGAVEEQELSEAPAS